jgi:hypothetical protein
MSSVMGLSFMNESTRWMQAAIALSSDPEAKVLCPKNEDAYLEVYDVAFEGRKERWIHCPECKAANAMRM